jgi:hypothetical protein
MYDENNNDFETQEQSEVDPGIGTDVTPEERATFEGDGYDKMRLEYLRSPSRKMMTDPKSTLGGMGMDEETAWGKWFEHHKDDVKPRTDSEMLQEIQNDRDLRLRLTKQFRGMKKSPSECIQAYLKYHDRG